MYGENGAKIYFQEIDSIVQIKFRKNSENNKKLEIAKKVNPNINISMSKSNRIDIIIGKDKHFDYNDLKKDGSVVYANRSLMSEDEIVQIPTDKILVKVRREHQLEEILSKLNIVYESYKRLGHNENSYVITLKDGESLNVANTLYESGYFEYAQPSFTRFIKMMNEFYSNEWALNNTGQYGGTEGIDINAPEAWQLTKGSRYISVAVIDQGVSGFGSP